MRIGIVAHTSRSDMATDLASRVQADTVSIDDGTLRCRGNHRLVWERLALLTDPDEWAIVLEDDAVPVDDFRTEAERALDRAPAGVVSLYIGKSRPRQWMDRVHQAVAAAERRDASWITADYMLHAVGIALRGADLIERMLHATKDFRRPPDECFSMWSRRYGHPIAYTWPSLVDHADAPPAIDIHTDGEGRPPGRVAWQRRTRDHWTARSVNL